MKSEVAGRPNRIEAQRSVAHCYLAEEVRRDPLFKKGLAQLAVLYPSFFPLNRTTLANGVPIEVILAVAELAYCLGLNSLRAPWTFLTRYTEVGLGFPTSELEETEAKLTAFQRKTLRRDVSWFYQRYRQRQSTVALALSLGKAVETSKGRVARIRVLLDVHRTWGRPNSHHYSPQ